MTLSTSPHYNHQLVCTRTCTYKNTNYKTYNSYPNIRPVVTCQLGSDNKNSSKIPSSTSTIEPNARHSHLLLRYRRPTHKTRTDIYAQLNSTTEYQLYHKKLTRRFAADFTPCARSLTTTISTINDWTYSSTILDQKSIRMGTHKLSLTIIISGSPSGNIPFYSRNRRTASNTPPADED